MGKGRREGALRVPSLANCLKTLKFPAMSPWAIKLKIKVNTGGREGVGRFTGLPLWTGWVGREAVCLLFFPLLLQLAFVLSPLGHKVL
jgi:hypothetical protein